MASPNVRAIGGPIRGRAYGQVGGAPELRGIGFVDVSAVRTERCDDELVAGPLPGPELRVCKGACGLNDLPERRLRRPKMRADRSGQVTPLQLPLEARGKQ